MIMTVCGGNKYKGNHSMIDETVVQSVWQKGAIVPSYDPSVYRKDQCGAWMQRTQYGNRNSPYGWEVHHITAISRGGSDGVSNLQPLQWRNNLATGDGGLRCAVTAS